MANLLKFGLFNLLLVFCRFRDVTGYRPVVYMHGIFSTGGTGSQLLQWINESHPGTETFAINMFEDNESIINLSLQVEKIGAWLAGLMEKYTAGINLICFSQGGQVCRGIIEHMDHNVHTFISLSAPQAGQFGLTKDISKIFHFRILVRNNLYRLLYTHEGQLVSVGNYWNDPRHQDLYRKMCKYLATLNNDILHNKSQVYKNNFTKLKKLVLIGGPDDGVIEPWQSSQFGFYDDKMNVKKMTDTTWFKNDTFGLQTLYKRHALVTCTFPGLRHSAFPSTKKVFDTCILPHLA